MSRKLIINIGRQFGSGGLLVGKELGRKLGFPVYDRELITKAAQDSGFSKEIFIENDEKRSFLSLTSIFTQSFCSDDNDYMSGSHLFKIQSETIRKIAEQGSAVILGRCSDYILRDMDCTLDVFLTASDEIRAARIAERSGLDLDEATQLMEKKDRSREQYYNYFTFGNWGMATNYDLCIDTGIVGIENAADIIIDFAVKAGRL